MVNEKIVKKRSDFCLRVECWSTGFEVAECEAEWLQTVRKKCHSLRAMVITRNQYVQINTGIPEKVITETSGHKSSKALWCYERTLSVHQ